VEIKYVKHPVTAEDKKELNKQGFKIIDIKFKPIEEIEEVEPVAKKTPKRKTI
jgi:hypothetical protein